MPTVLHIGVYFNSCDLWLSEAAPAWVRIPVIIVWLSGLTQNGIVEDATPFNGIVLLYSEAYGSYAFNASENGCHYRGGGIAHKLYLRAIVFGSWQCASILNTTFWEVCTHPSQCKGDTFTSYPVIVGSIQWRTTPFAFCRLLSCCVQCLPLHQHIHCIPLADVVARLLLSQDRLLKWCDSDTR